MKTEMEGGKPKAYRYELPYEGLKGVTGSANVKEDVEFSSCSSLDHAGVTSNSN